MSTYTAVRYRCVCQPLSRCIHMSERKEGWWTQVSESQKMLAEMTNVERYGDGKQGQESEEIPDCAVETPA